ncbi:ABC transporter permease, partial [Pseudoalteromonas sp. S409]
MDLFQQLGHNSLGRCAALGGSAYMVFSALAHDPNFIK